VQRSVARSVLFALAFALSLASILLVIHRALETAAIEPLTPRQHLARIVANRVGEIRSLEPAPGLFEIVFLGDSMAVSYPMPLSVPRQLEQATQELAGGDPPLRVHSLAFAGTGSFDYYFLADLIASSEPDLIVISFNLASVSARWQASFARPELAGWIGLPRLAETLRLPLGWIGLTHDRLLFYSAIVRLGASEAWIALTREQTRVGIARESLEQFFAVKNTRGKSPEQRFESAKEYRTIRQFNARDLPRYTALGQRSHFGLALDGIPLDNPSLVVLGRTLHHFHRMGIRTLVYVTPFNYEHSQHLGILDEAGLRRSIASIEANVRGAGSEFVDLHRLFPDSHFRDRPGHFVYEGGVIGTRKVGRALAPAVLAIARRSAEESS
jgi:hypothetical protein